MCGTFLCAKVCAQLYNALSLYFHTKFSEKHIVLARAVSLYIYVRVMRGAKFTLLQTDITSDCREVFNLQFDFNSGLP